MAIGSNVSRTSSTGLLPQLTEVLHALCESHELLLLKLQSVRLEHISVVASGTEEFPHTRFLAFVDPGPSAVDTKTRTADDVHRALPIDVIELSTEPSSTMLIGPATDANPYDADASVISHVETSVPLRASTGVVATDRELDAMSPPQAPTECERPLAVRADPAGVEPADRNYNFFDELDTKLTHRKNPESDSGEH